MGSKATLPKGKPMDKPMTKVAAVNDTRKMTTRTTLPPQPKGKAADKPTNKLADARNRKPLKEIGNLAVVPQRPVTRKLSAKLQASDRDKALQDHSCDAVNSTKNGKEEDRKAQEVIEISPDTEKLPEREEEGASSKKRATITHSSILAARSRAVIDIDAADAGDHLAVVEYVEDLYVYYKATENDNKLFKYMALQPDVTPRMRSILVDWLIDVHHKFELSQETLYLTVNIIDRYMAKETIARREIQLLGISAMLTASKYEEIWAPEVNDLVMISDRTYSRGEILTMEKSILRVLGWCLTVPTPYVFLVRFVKASVGDMKSEPAVRFVAEFGMKSWEMLVSFVAELGLMSYDVMVRFRPSMFAAAAVYVARCAAQVEPRWNETLRLHTGYEERDLRDCAEVLSALHEKAPADLKLKAASRKYSSYPGVVNSLSQASSS